MARAQSIPIGQRLQSLPKNWLYAILFLFATIPLFLPISVPNEPIDASKDFYNNLMKLPNGSRILIASDWTNSTRGESGGQMDALLRIVMRKNIKFCIYSTADPQAPQVARDSIGRIAKEVREDGGPDYQQFRDYVVAGYFPNSEGTNLAINNNIRTAFAGRKELNGGKPTDIMQSPVFQGVSSVADFKYLVLVATSSTNTVILERVKKTPLLFMVTGVMVPENIVYYTSGQLKGLVGGVKGVYDLETLMEKGNGEDAPPTPGTDKLKAKGLLKGTAYYPTLHFCMFLLIIAVVIGNVGMAMSRRGSR